MKPTEMLKFTSQEMCAGVRPLKPSGVRCARAPREERERERERAPEAQLGKEDGWVPGEWAARVHSEFTQNEDVLGREPGGGGLGENLISCVKH